MSQAAQSQLSEGCTPGEALGLDPANTAAPEARDITYDQRGQPGLQRALNSTSRESNSRSHGAERGLAQIVRGEASSAAQAANEEN